MIGIPEKLKIGGLIYDVIPIEDRNREHGMNNTGSCNVGFQKIWIEYGNRKIEGVKDDLLHEILEAIVCQCNIDMSHQTLTTLGTMLLQVLKDNRLVFFEGEK